MLKSLLKGVRTSPSSWKSGNEILSTNGPIVQQVRNKWANWLMIRDVKRRRMNAEHSIERLRINAMRRNKVLPIQIREEADVKINQFPLDSTPLRMNKRCMITSRPRGIVHDFRLSRMVFRHLVDYNKMSGIQRAMWGFS